LSKLLVLSLLLLSSVAFGQVEQTGRWEIGMPNDNNETFKVIADSLGLIVYSQQVGNDQDVIELIRLDTALQEKWKGYIGLDRGLIISQTATRKNSLYVLLRNPRFAGFVLINLDIVTGKYTTHLIKNAIPFLPTEFAATNGAVMIGGYYNYRPLVLHYSFSLEKSKILPGFFNEPGELTQMKVTEDGAIDIIVSAKNFEKKKSLWIRNYNSEGDLIKTTVLESREKRNLIFGRSIKMPNNEQVVAGVYGRNTEYSRGIFVATISTYGEYTIRYYNFADLQNFFHYLKANQERRIKKRIERRKVKGKNTKFNYRLLVQELIPYRDQFVLLGEAFYPRYVYRSRYNSSPLAGFNNSRGYSNYSPYNNDYVFDGYQYTHAIAIGFDATGKVRWDNSFEINDVKSFTLEQFVKIAPADDHIDLLYLFENLIRSKVIRDNQVLEGKTSDELKVFSDEGLITKEDAKTSHLDYWYDHHLFASGVQNVRRTKEKKEVPFKKVFFINKIRYR
jgi:hypothetical protein